MTTYATKTRHKVASYGFFPLLILHALGILTIVYWDRDFYAQFTSINLLITGLLLGFSQPGKWHRVLLYFLVCAILGFAIEWIGTHTGWPFGEYSYGSNLIPLISGVPLVIGINWFVLSLAGRSLAAAIFKSPWAYVPVAALMMTGIDLFIEPVAPLLDFWTWEEGRAPLANYLSWFGFSVLLQLVHYFLLPKAVNKLALPYFFLVWAFFLYMNWTL